MTRTGMVHFILRRLAVAVPLLLIISFGVFTLVKLAPGDPVRALIGSRPANAETIAAIREEFHLNDPFLVQYGKWLGQAQEFYAGLREKGVTAEIAVYPREGHGLRERAHRMDAWERTLAWFDRYLRPPGR